MANGLRLGIASPRRRLARFDRAYEHGQELAGFLELPRDLVPGDDGSLEGQSQPETSFARFFASDAQLRDEVWLGLTLFRFLGIGADRRSTFHELRGDVASCRPATP